LVGILPLEFTTGMGGVVALRRRGGTVHESCLVLFQVAKGGFLGVVTEVVFVVAVMVGKRLDVCQGHF
jgi:hypothetical protein